MKGKFVNVTNIYSTNICLIFISPCCDLQVLIIWSPLEQRYSLICVRNSRNSIFKQIFVEKTSVSLILQETCMHAFQQWGVNLQRQAKEYILSIFSVAYGWLLFFLCFVNNFLFCPPYFLIVLHRRVPTSTFQKKKKWQIIDFFNITCVC